MALIKSISGIRGTIGGKVGESLSPIDIVKFSYAYCKFLKERFPNQSLTIVVGRDARISGEIVEQLVCATVSACGINVKKGGKISTPTTEMAVILEKAHGGLILTASHNPKQWNALKMLNENGEFLTDLEGKRILELAEKDDFDFANIDEIGKISEEKSYIQRHIEAILAMKEIDFEAIKKAKFTVVLDAINSVGAGIIPNMLEKMGVKCLTINGEMTGDFAHNPEPLKENLVDLCRKVREEKADLGISVDPDVDRLSLICENGEPFGEDYTLVAVADYLFGSAKALAKKENKTMEEIISPYKLISCSNLSSSRALKDLTESYGGAYFASAVGEVNVSTLIHEKGAYIGGEGNGGVIFPSLHCGRDAVLGIAIILSLLAHKKMSLSQIKESYPQYFMAKDKISLSDKVLIDKILTSVKEKFQNKEISLIDGVKISFEESKSWVHLRRSNTEPIIRIYSEAPSLEEAEKLNSSIKELVGKIIEHTK